MDKDLIHRAWLDREYQEWIKGLRESGVNSFKDHPAVKRMLGEVDPAMFDQYLTLNAAALLTKIDNIGRKIPEPLSGSCLRMAYYAKKILDIAPTSIEEIGGGSGQFYAVLRALGYDGTYYIHDLPEVQEFQRSYLNKIGEVTGLELNLLNNPLHDFCCSFYAIGEFDNHTKNWYVEHVINRCEHGLVIWNPHSGASPEIPWVCKVTDEFPLTYEGNKELVW